VSELGVLVEVLLAIPAKATPVTSETGSNEVCADLIE
jgi:hypothetical protein